MEHDLDKIIKVIKMIEYMITTRLHSSRMRTARALSVSPSMLGGCTWVPGGVPGLRGCTWSQGVYLIPDGCIWSWGRVCSGGVHLVLGGVWSKGGVPGPRGMFAPGGFTWYWGEWMLWGV